MNVVKNVPRAGMRNFISLPQLVSMEPESSTDVQSMS